MANSVTEFLHPFFKSDEMVCARVFAAKGLDKKIARKFYFTPNELKQDRQLQGELKEYNRNCGVYFVVNQGGDRDDEIERINAVFCEIDDKPIAEQHDIFDHAPLPPSIRVETKKSVHAYWLLDEYITPNQFRNAQRGLINFFKSDPALHNPARVMRLPFFNHVSFDGKQFDYTPVRIHTFNQHRFTLCELSEVYPYNPPPRAALPKFKDFDAKAKFEVTRRELVDRIQQTPGYYEENGWGYTVGLCHHGEVSKNALYVHLSTLYIGCFGGCSFEKIAATFGISFKNKK